MQDGWDDREGGPSEDSSEIVVDQSANHAIAVLPIGFLYTDHCNARCAHCSTNCGPQKRTYLSEDSIFRIISEASRLNTPLQICFSGGEPFLDLPLLNRLVGFARLHANEVTCVTNGFWATGFNRAVEVLEELKASGLTAIALSASAFHEQYVPSKRVATALAAAGACALKRILKFPVANGGESASEWADRMQVDLEGIAIEEFGVMPTVRTGAEFPASAFRRLSGIPKGCCPGPTITIRETGDAYTCCTPGAFVEPLRLGSAQGDGFQYIFDRFALGGLQQILREEGPSYFAAHLTRLGLGGRLRESYDGICDLCTHIFSDGELATACEEIAAAKELAMLAEFLGVDVSDHSALNGICGVIGHSTN